MTAPRQTGAGAVGAPTPAPADPPRAPGLLSRTAGDAALALTFLTRLPAPAAPSLGTGALGRSIFWFPVVGAIVGGVLGGTRLLAELAVPAGPATAIALAAAVVVTGGLHEDGLADAADGLGAHATRERRLEIMRDPRVGTFGALALIVSFAIAWSLLAGLDATDCLLAAMVAHTLARWAMPVAAAFFSRARSGGAAGLMTVGRGGLGAATVAAVAIALAAGGLVPGLVAVAAALATTAAVGAYATRALGGITGDIYGATGKAVEVACLLVIAAFAS